MHVPTFARCYLGECRGHSLGVRLAQGSPIVLANSLLAGGRAFLAEPAKARSPKAFARGVASGVSTDISLALSPMCR